MTLCNSVTCKVWVTLEFSRRLGNLKPKPFDFCIKYIMDIYFFVMNTKNISSNVLKTSVFSRVRSTSENADVSTHSMKYFRYLPKTHRGYKTFFFFFFTHNVTLCNTVTFKVWVTLEFSRHHGNLT